MSKKDKTYDEMSRVLVFPAVLFFFSFYSAFTLATSRTVAKHTRTINTFSYVPATKTISYVYFFVNVEREKESQFKTRNKTLPKYPVCS